MNKLATKRLNAIVSLLNDLELISHEELPEEQRNALCINVNGWRYYPSFQFDEHCNLLDNLRNNLSLMREGRDDTDILLWMVSEKSVLVERAFAPPALVSKYLDNGDLEGYERLVSAEARSHKYVTAKPCDLIDDPLFEIFVEDWLRSDERQVSSKYLKY
ncbi:hypothetical protein [Vibrio parahaemolyticus]|uniref:hypothetical protein n=1 Tax=Vibrio parahaemolyticus TaxID=670 RepID=UPI00215BE118|nr:hypothetical protein [Vibrio parahaemolyticus]MCS0016372.1 hypothetical protein [Vibrio parahaemolyticus]